MLRLTTITCLLAALFSASCVLADSIPQATPSPELVEDTRNLEPRQNLGVVPDATLATGQAGPVTVYDILVVQGQTAVPETFTHTQLFVAVPDQWPSPQPGTIGMGSLKQKRNDVPARANTPTVTQVAVNTGIAGRIRT
ncbi:hypothetical protein LTR37_018608 [Vermiconidia calcicola]|uniref:Uncharacterized protein n=1 Tax=Vermiconidia calcicola TaxID=1690605 RepID=A0ACC3MHZ2_9PEZI|nr:hypothetical protein LTR37_018608 [Vermiconidia calcicola]